MGGWSCVMLQIPREGRQCGAWGRGGKGRKWGEVLGFLKSFRVCSWRAPSFLQKAQILLIWALPVQIPELPKYNCVPPHQGKAMDLLGLGCHSPSTLVSTQTHVAAKGCLREAGGAQAPHPHLLSIPHLLPTHLLSAVQGGRRPTGGWLMERGQTAGHR